VHCVYNEELEFTKDVYIKCLKSLKLNEQLLAFQHIKDAPISADTDNSLYLKAENQYIGR